MPKPKTTAAAAAAAPAAPAPKKLIAYYRVSTQEQGQSGRGLEAQQTCVANYAKAYGGQVIRSYQEVESGARRDRPALEKALGHARRSKATIVVGKLDRLARDAFLIAKLLDEKVPFVACDMPEADDTMKGMYSYFAQREHKLISARVREAMAAAKGRGRTFGTLANLTQAGRVKGAARAGLTHRKQADQAYADLLPLMRELRAEGQSLAAIAARLNADGEITRRGGSWSPTQVMRVLNRGEVAARA